MRSRAATRLVWSSFVVMAVLLVAMAMLSAGREAVFDTIHYGVLPFSLATVGALVATGHPRNPVGWLFCGLALYEVLAECAEGWGYFAAERGLLAGALAHGKEGDD
jgi:hypothetical protein